MIAKYSRRLVFATWALAAISFLTLLFTAYFMHSQVTELARSNELAWRPFANIDATEVGAIVFTYTIGSRPDTGRPDLRLVDKVAIGTDAYKARSQVAYNYVRPVTIRNSGTTPLWLKGRITAILTEEEWIGFERDPGKLLTQVLGWGKLKKYPNDVVIQRDSTFTTDSTQGIPRTMTVQHFDSLQFLKHRLVLYPYTCIRYEDYMGKEYFALRMAAIVFGIDTLNSLANVNVRSISEEIYRWDVKQK